jgi:hypothetical protein
MRAALLALACMTLPKANFVPLPSQRATAEVRRLEAEASEARRLTEVANEEKTNTKRQRNSVAKELKEVKQELKEALPATMAGKATDVKRITPKSAAFYEHVQFGVSWLRRFHILDVPMILVACMRSLGRESETDVCRDILMDKGMDTTRARLLHDHEKEIAAHLQEKVYTADHFSLLRLITGMSKRACGLINQSLKYVHNRDGTKTRQVMHPGSTVPAPDVFALKAIIESENRAEKESNFELRQHEDKRGADICGKVCRAAAPSPMPRHSRGFCRARTAPPPLICRRAAATGVRAGPRHDAVDQEHDAREGHGDARLEGRPAPDVHHRGRCWG